MNTATVALPERRGETSYRTRLVSGAASGLLAGLVFAMLSMAYGAIAGPSVWAPPRMIATIAGFEMDASFAIVPVMVGLAMHMVLSMLYGAGFAVVAGGLARNPLVVAGVMFGLVLYVVNFHVMAQWPPFTTFRMMAGNWFEIAVHAVYGLLVAAGIAASRRRDDAPIA